MTAGFPCSQCPSTATTRRAWIKRMAMSYSAWAGLSGAWTAPAARGAVIDPNHRLRLNVDAFVSLALNGGSAIITFDGGQTVILINRESDIDFHVLTGICTHENCRVDPYSITTNTVVCPCHGSQFDIQGQVIQGPAVNNLSRFAAHFEPPSILNIEVPGLVHRLDQIAIHSSSAGGMRLRLTFPTTFGSEYQIRHSPDLATAFEVVPFASSAGGVANETVFYGSGFEESVYVDTSGGAGFFVLELVIQQLA